MEIISIAGYIADEKMRIARDYLEKNTREASGIKPEQVEITDAALLALIENYCREAGVWNLQKQIEKIYRKIALQLVRQGLSNEPPQGVTIVESTKLEDKNLKNSLAEDAFVDVNRTDSSLENIDMVPLTTISEVDPNEHSNEAPTETAAEGFVGMALSYGLSLNMSFVFSVQNQCQLANQFISVERVNQYLDVTSEAAKTIEENRPSSDWPIV